MSLKILTSIKLLSDFILVKYNNKKLLWWSLQIYFETTRPIHAGQELFLPPREPMQLDYLLSCNQPDDRSDRESGESNSNKPRSLFDTALEFFTQEKKLETIVIAKNDLKYRTYS